MHSPLANPLFVAVLLLVGLAGVLRADDAAAAKPVQTGETVLQTGFGTAAERQAWPRAGFAAWETLNDGRATLRVTVPPAQAAKGNMVTLPLDLARYRGCRLLVECMARADQVGKPPEPYLGVKCMLHYESKAEGPLWQNENGVYGTFDWRRLQFIVRIAPDAANGEIAMGLQGSSGTVWFDDLKITVAAAPVVRPAPLANPPPAFRGHRVPRLRGVMSPNQFRDEDLWVLGEEWKANVIRWQLTRNWGRPGTDRDLAEYDRWLDGRLAELDQALVACRRYGLKVVIDLHSPPGGRYENGDLAIFHEAAYQTHFIALWEKIARRYQGNSAVWGYDLINEPAQTQPPPAGVADYLGAQVLAAKAIRAIDPQIPMFIESAQWDSPAAYRDLEPVAIPNVIYEVHMYAPHGFTHQGVRGPWTPTAYPGAIAGAEWNKERIRRELQPVRDFQRAYNVHVYVGEFSAIRWAPGAERYLRDCIEVFEEYGWDWSYHAYREWDGWSVEHGGDPQDHRPAATPTARKLLLLEWFGKNVCPD